MVKGVFVVLISEDSKLCNLFMSSEKHLYEIMNDFALAFVDIQAEFD